MIFINIIHLSAQVHRRYSARDTIVPKRILLYSPAVNIGLYIFLALESQRLRACMVPIRRENKHIILRIRVTIIWTDNKTCDFLMAHIIM